VLEGCRIDRGEALVDHRGGSRDDGAQHARPGRRGRIGIGTDTVHGAPCHRELEVAEAGEPEALARSDHTGLGDACGGGEVGDRAVGHRRTQVQDRARHLGVTGPQRRGERTDPREGPARGVGHDRRR
jgi:hypothetical protein